MTDETELTALGGLDKIVKQPPKTTTKKQRKPKEVNEDGTIKRPKRTNLAKQPGERGLQSDTVLQPEEGRLDSDSESGTEPASVIEEEIGGRQTGSEGSEVDSSQEETRQKEEVIPQPQATIAHVVSKNKKLRKAKLVDLARWRGLHRPSK